MTIPGDTHPDDEDDDDAHSLSTEYAELPSHKLLAKLQKQRLQANPRRKTVEKKQKKNNNGQPGSIPLSRTAPPARTVGTWNAFTHVFQNWVASKH